MQPLLWFRFYADCKRWSVFFSTDRITPELKNDDGSPLYGVCVYARKRIFIHAGRQRTEIVPTLVHEATHAFLHAADLPDWIEEPLVYHLESHLASLLMQLNAELPPLPDGFEAMRKQYRQRKRKH
jgi:hypothetical protein